MFDKQQLLWIAAAIAAAYYLWPTIRSWFVRPEPEPPPLPEAPRARTADDGFWALKELREFYLAQGASEQQTAALLAPHLPHLFGARFPGEREPFPPSTGEP